MIPRGGRGYADPRTDRERLARGLHPDADLGYDDDVEAGDRTQNDQVCCWDALWAAFGDPAAVPLSRRSLA